MENERKVGRPSAYTPSLGVKILEHMEDGLSLVAACGEVNIPRQTVYDWQKVYPEFRELIELGHSKRLAFLERRTLKDSLTGPQATVTIFALKNASPEWRQDVQKIDINQNVNHNLKLDSLSQDQLAQLALMLAPKGSEPLTIEGSVVDDEE